MAEFKTTDIGSMATTTGYTLIVKSPPFGEFEIRDGGIVVENTTTTDHNLKMEIRKGTKAVTIFDNTLKAKETFLWERIIRIPSDFTGIFARFDVAPATAPDWYYTGSIGGA